MSEKEFQLEIVTPDGEVFSGSVNSVVLPGVEGEIEILSNHAAMLAMLQPGLSRYTAGNDAVKLVTGSGFVQVADNKVSVLVELAEGKGEKPKEIKLPDDASPEVVREARLIEKARQRLAE